MTSRHIQYYIIWGKFIHNDMDDILPYSLQRLCIRLELKYYQTQNH